MENSIFYPLNLLKGWNVADETKTEEEEAENFKFLVRTFGNKRSLRDAWLLLRDHPDKDAETIVTDYMQTPEQRASIQRLWVSAGWKLKITGSDLQDHDWEQRFQERLRQEDVPPDFDKAHKSYSDWRETYRDEPDFYIQCIKYLYCAGEFIKTDLNKEAVAARKQAAAAREEVAKSEEIQLDMLEAMHMAGFLKCDLPER